MASSSRPPPRGPFASSFPFAAAAAASSADAARPPEPDLALQLRGVQRTSSAFGAWDGAPKSVVASPFSRSTTRRSEAAPGRFSPRDALPSARDVSGRVVDQRLERGVLAPRAPAPARPVDGAREDALGSDLQVRVEGRRHATVLPDGGRCRQRGAASAVRRWPRVRLDAPDERFDAEVEPAVEVAVEQQVDRAARVRVPVLRAATGCSREACRRSARAPCPRRWGRPGPRPCSNSIAPTYSANRSPAYAMT